MPTNPTHPDVPEGLKTWRWNGHWLFCVDSDQTAAPSDTPLIYVSQLPAIRHQERERMRELATELDERADACERGNGPEATGEASSYSAAAGLLRDRLDAAKGEGRG